MPYATLTDLLRRVPEETLIQLTDDISGTDVNEDIVDTAISEADEEIDAYLSMRYSLPFASTPAIVVRMSADLAVCRLYARCGHIELPKQWEERRQAVGRMLEKLAEGKLKIDVPDAAVVDSAGIEATSSRSDRIFIAGRVSDGSTGNLDN